MKIRIKGNSLRLRLSQSELKSFAEKGQVSENICFGVGQQLQYSLLKKKCSGIYALFEESKIIVYVPEDEASDWVGTDLIGLNASQDNGNGTLKILIEKDFQCLVKREGEDDVDAFPNPLSLK